jgi:hypothetical protein
VLDAVNEMPHGGEEDYHEGIALWRGFLTDLARSAPGTRVVFSCRSLAYSASLSTPELPVPHIRIERLADEQVEEFLTLSSPDQGPALWRQLKGTAQLDLLRSPFYLKLLLAQAQPGATLLQGVRRCSPGSCARRSPARWRPHRTDPQRADRACLAASPMPLTSPRCWLSAASSAPPRAISSPTGSRLPFAASASARHQETRPR